VVDGEGVNRWGEQTGGGFAEYAVALAARTVTRPSEVLGGDGGGGRVCGGGGVHGAAECVAGGHRGGGRGQ
jgi:hypothetical protein